MQVADDNATVLKLMASSVAYCITVVKAGRVRVGGVYIDTPIKQR